MYTHTFKEFTTCDEENSARIFQPSSYPRSHVQNSKKAHILWGNAVDGRRLRPPSELDPSSVKPTADGYRIKGTHAPPSDDNNDVLESGA